MLVLALPTAAHVPLPLAGVPPLAQRRLRDPPRPDEGLRQNVAWRLESPWRACRRTETKRGVA